MRTLVVVLMVGLAGSAIVPAQAPPEFEAVSIRRNKDGPDAGGGLRTLPDGTMIMTNQPIAQIIRNASPVAVREVAGLPAWANDERYDVTAKPPAGSTREQRSQMWRAMFVKRMQLVSHVENREIDAFALLVARTDGRLGPQMARSTADCERPAAEPTGNAGVLRSGRCGLSFGASRIEAAGLTMDMLVQSLGSLAGGLVTNRTGLEGRYDLRLDFSAELAATDVQPSNADVLPNVFTALREQLGLKLEREKTVVPIFVIDSIERPSEN